MNRSGNELFAGAGFSQDEHGRIGGCHCFDLDEDMRQTAALADNRVEVAFLGDHWRHHRAVAKRESFPTLRQTTRSG